MSTRMYDKPSEVHSILNSRILVNQMRNGYIFFLGQNDLGHCDWFLFR